MFLFDWFYSVLATLGLWQKEAKILFFGLWQKEAKILFLRFDNAAKTNLLQMLKDKKRFTLALWVWERLVQHQPTQFATHMEFGIGKIKFKAFDFGSYQSARRVLTDYYAKVDVILYLLDGNRADDEGFKESFNALNRLVKDDSWTNVPFLVFAYTGDPIAFRYVACYHGVPGGIKEIWEHRWHGDLENYSIAMGRDNLLVQAILRSILPNGECIL